MTNQEEQAIKIDVEIVKNTIDSLQHRAVHTGDSMFRELSYAFQSILQLIGHNTKED